MIAGALVLEVASTADVSASFSLICPSLTVSIIVGSHKKVEQAEVEFLLNTSLSFAVKFVLLFTQQSFLIVISFFLIVVVFVGADGFVTDDKIGVSVLLLLLAIYEEQ